MHDKGCETGIVEFVVKFRVNDKPAVNARQRVVKRTPEGILIFVWNLVLEKPHFFSFLIQTNFYLRIKP